ncbi:unnamed protein product [Paramecium pentaurelia]|uniref:Uncharacterized protein n=1 Tax=Paramecium pentaurelia TaxID=43138 RepID=A0A8S1UU15_9CILI|nr:unnamed protein product [Paramecium pentaurelia]
MQIKRSLIEQNRLEQFLDGNTQSRILYHLQGKTIKKIISNPTKMQDTLFKNQFKVQKIMILHLNFIFLKINKYVEIYWVLKKEIQLQRIKLSFLNRGLEVIKSIFKLIKVSLNSLENRKNSMFQKLNQADLFNSQKRTFLVQLLIIDFSRLQVQEYESIITQIIQYIHLYRSIN